MSQICHRKNSILKSIMKSAHCGNGMIGPAMFTMSYLWTSIYQKKVRLDRSLCTFAVPCAKKIPSFVHFGVNLQDPTELRGTGDVMNPPIRSINDPYNWMRDETREDKIVLNHLIEENNYCKDQMKHLEPLQNTLYNEILHHLKETDEDVPFPYGNYEYYSRTVKQLSYKIHCRRLLNGGKEEIVLNENEVAIGKDYCVVGDHIPSPDHSLLAYSVDDTGYETYKLYFKEIHTGKLIGEVLEGISGEILWGSDSSTLFYMKMDEEHRPYKAFMHVLGTSQSQDICFFTENDQRFWMGMDKTNSDKFLIIGVESKETSEIYVLDLENLTGSQDHINAVKSNGLKCIQKRMTGMRYSVEHHGNYLLILTNKDGAKNNKFTRVLISTLYNTIGDGSCDTWIDVKPYDDKININDAGIIPFENYISIFGRHNGTEVVWISTVNTIDNVSSYSDWIEIPINESTYSINQSQNWVYSSDNLRLGYSSFLTPKQIFDYNMKTGEKVILKEQEVPGYERNNYISQRIEATAKDGTKIPISIVYHKKSNVGADFNKPDDKSPVLLYGYGSYGACIDPTFDYKRLSLLDRGVVYAIAHIRGGGEMGRGWYEDGGKYLTKMNTFTDFACCANHLIDIGITTSEKIAIVGRSAGGLLIGACVNMFPNLFKAAVADVPFVDVLNTMADPTIPLTIGEWEEWGNPNEARFHDYMKAYSPYDNVEEKAYPSMLVTAGLNDPRVAYWEPAKWVSKLRDMKTDSNPILLKTDLSSGHFSASDRYKFIKETSFEYSFILNKIGAENRID